jgi:hypothetical protein
MPAGMEMDRRIAEVFLPQGEWFVSSPRSDNVIVWRGEAWMPSINMADTIYIITFQANRGLVVSVGRAKGPGPFFCQIDDFDGEQVAHKSADTLALAVCRAALWAGSGGA